MLEIRASEEVSQNKLYDLTFQRILGTSKRRSPYLCESYKAQHCHGNRLQNFRRYTRRSFDCSIEITDLSWREGKGDIAEPGVAAMMGPLIDLTCVSS